MSLQKFHCGRIEHIWVSLWNFFSAPSVSRGSTYLRKTQNISKKWFLGSFFNLKNSSKTCFSWIHTCFDEDMEAYECAIDMVDGALETLDLTLSKRGIVWFTFGYFVDDSDSFSKFSFFEFFENFSRIAFMNDHRTQIFKITKLTIPTTHICQ